MTFQPLLILWLVVVWVALWGDFSVANVLTGVCLAVLLIVALPRGTGRGRRPLRPAAVLRFLGHFVVALVQSNIDVARHVLTPGEDLREGILALELRGADDLVTTIVANAITLTPGTLTLEVEDVGDVRTLYVHVLHLESIDAIREELLTLEDLAQRAFGTDAMTEVAR